MMKLDTERRKYPRLDVALNASFSKMNLLGNATDSTSASIRNISGTGAFVETDKPLHEGALVEMEFCLIDNNNPVKAEAIVRWLGRFEDCCDGMGVEFLGVN